MRGVIMKRRFLFQATILIAAVLVCLLAGQAAPGADDSSRRSAHIESPECHERLGCSALIAGKNTTADGSILFAKTEDDTPDDVDFLWYIPRRRHEPGSVVKLQNGGAIPQVAETYAFFWDQNPGTPFSNNVVNEWGVSLGSDACPSREDPVEEVAARGDIVDGGLAFELRIVLAERAQTAREAVEIAAELLDTYGYNASGRCLHIVGPDEAWQLQMVRGRQYVARRVRDDEVAITANTYTIREVDMDDRENFICSPRLVDYAVERGWYDPSGGEPFDFAAVYADPKAHVHPANTDRTWGMARLLDADFPVTYGEARSGILPPAVKPDHELTINDIMEIFRDHYEGTALDSTENYRISPHRSTVRPICCLASHRTTIIQQRSWLPPEIGTIVWRALEPPCTSGFVPWYLGATRIPAPFQMAPLRADTARTARVDFHFNMPPETWRLGLESSGALFKLLANLVDGDYARTIPHVRAVWDEFEAEELAMQAAVEETALKLYKGNRSLALEFITLYSNALAEKSLDVARSLIEEIPRTAGTLTAHGLYHFKAGSLDEAIEKFEEALECEPDHEDARWYLEWTRDQKRCEENPPSVPRETLERYAGDYGPRHVTLRDGSLYYQRDERPEFRLMPISEDTFALEGFRQFRLRFVAGEDGAIEKVIGVYFEGSTDESIREP
jgi:dipeptidase